MRLMVIDRRRKYAKICAIIRHIRRRFRNKKRVRHRKRVRHSKNRRRRLKHRKNNNKQSSRLRVPPTTSNSLRARRASKMRVPMIQRERVPSAKPVDLLPKNGKTDYPIATSVQASSTRTCASRRSVCWIISNGYHLNPCMNSLPTRMHSKDTSPIVSRMPRALMLARCTRCWCCMAMRRAMR